MLAQDAMTRLRALGDPRSVEQGRKFFKQGEYVALYGVNVPRVRAVVRELHGAIEPWWALGDAVTFCDVMVRNRFLEAKFLGLVMLGRFRRDFGKPLFRIIERWIRGGHLPNWAAIDCLGGEVLTPLISRYPELLRRMAPWRRSRNQWLRRAAVVALVVPARNGRHLDVAYASVRQLLNDPEDLMHKACGWLLREAGKTDMERLERFLRRHGPRMPRTTVRYAIERFPEQERQRLLKETRAARP